MIFSSSSRDLDVSSEAIGHTTPGLGDKGGNLLQNIVSWFLLKRLDDVGNELSHEGRERGIFLRLLRKSARPKVDVGRR